MSRSLLRGGTKTRLSLGIFFHLGFHMLSPQLIGFNLLIGSFLNALAAQKAALCCAFVGLGSFPSWKRQHHPRHHHHPPHQDRHP